jgi:short-subunit dehydrogenase
VTYVALITGASSGIGAATARRLAQDPDVQLVLVARREERLRALASECGRGTMYIPADLTDPTAAAQIAAAVQQHHGRLDLLVNNAGARFAAEFAHGGWENIEQHMRINFEAPVRLVEALLPLMRETRGEISRGSDGGGPLRS